MEIIDISPTVHAGLGVWPGDTPYRREILMDTDKGDHLGLSKVTTTLHLGAHTDAPNHYMPSSQGMSERSLHYYYGPVQVISVQSPQGGRIAWRDLQTQEIRAPRILLKTGSFPDPEKWNNDFCALSEELVDELARRNVLLVGLDTPSVDLFECKELKVHKRIHAHNMAILEGVVLSEVDDGLYTLCALPLKLKDADASPVRAVLIKNIS